MIQRKIDNFGRMTIPIELRKTLQLNVNDIILLIPQQDSKSVILKKLDTLCQNCNTAENLWSFENITLCGSCARKFKKLSNRRR